MSELKQTQLFPVLPLILIPLGLVVLVTLLAVAYSERCSTRRLRRQPATADKHSTLALENAENTAAPSHTACEEGGDSASASGPAQRRVSATLPVEV